MDLFSLIIYAAVNACILFRYITGPSGKIYEFPFWMALMAVGWFLPQAVGGYFNADRYPEWAYSSALFFAALCSIASWIGYEWAVKKRVKPGNWLGGRFDSQKLFFAAVGLCLFGFYFHYRLSSLTPEQITVTEYGQWTGLSVLNLFFATVFKIGVLALLFLYWGQRRLLNTRFLLFLIPSLVLMLAPIILGGRRADMMELVAFLLIPVWFVKGWRAPRIILIVCLMVGLIFINSIQLYRETMNEEKNLGLTERIQIALNQDYLGEYFKTIENSAPEIEKYIFRMDAVNKLGCYDYGLSHWNMLVFNYVPAQIVGHKLKSSLMMPIVTPYQAGFNVHQFVGESGATETGYMDAFASLSWLGFVKFYLIGTMMGLLYRYAMQGYFLPRLLYTFLLTAGMHAISHGTNDVLVRMWVYFFIFGFPIYHWARARKGQSRLKGRFGARLLLGRHLLGPKSPRLNV